MPIAKTQILFPALVISMIIWGVSWPSTKYLTFFGSVQDIAWLRYVFTTSGVFVLLKIIKVPFAIHKKGWGYLAVGSALITAYSLCFFAGLKNGLPGKGGVLVTTMTPIASYMMQLIVNQKKPNSSEIIGLLLGLLAACFLLHIWVDVGSMFQSGNAYFLISVLLWATLSRITAIASQYGSVLAFTWWMYLICNIVLTFFINISAIEIVLQKSQFLFWANLLFSAIINTGIATTIYFYATTKLGSARTSSYIYIVPFAAAISSYFVFAEPIHWYTIVGGALGILAIVWLNKNKRQV